MRAVPGVRARQRVRDGRRRDAAERRSLLDSPGVGVHIPPMVWGVQYKYSADAVLMVLASEHYDASDYLRDYDEYLELRRAAAAGKAI